MKIELTVHIVREKKDPYTGFLNRVLRFRNHIEQLQVSGVLPMSETKWIVRPPVSEKQVLFNNELPTTQVVKLSHLAGTQLDTFQ